MNYSITQFRNGSILLRFSKYPTPAQFRVIRKYRFHWSRSLRGWFAYADARRVKASLARAGVCTLLKRTEVFR